MLAAPLRVGEARSTQEAKEHHQAPPAGRCAVYGLFLINAEDNQYGFFLY